MQYANVQGRADERPYIIRQRLPDGTTGRVLVVAVNGARAVNRARDKWPGRTVLDCYRADDPATLARLARHDRADGIR